MKPRPTLDEWLKTCKQTGLSSSELGAMTEYLKKNYPSGQRHVQNPPPIRFYGKTIKKEEQSQKEYLAEMEQEYFENLDKEWA